MPYVQNKVRIYYEVIGHGPPIVLQYGIAGSVEALKRFKYVDALKDNYQLILVDARGHGKSDKPHEPGQYSMKHMTGDVVAVLDDLGITRANFWGYSMGGRIGLALGKYAPDRFSSLIIGGNGLSEKDSKHEVEELQEMARFFKLGIDAIIASLGKEWGDDLEWVKNLYRGNDLEALIAYCSFYENIGMADYLPKLDTPCFLYAGGEDTYTHTVAKACADIMRDAEFLSLPGFNHMQAFHQSSVVIPHVIRFLKKVT